MTKQQMLILLLGLFMVAPILAAPVMQEPRHWHGADVPHGDYMGQTLNAADCEALFGGEGWE